MKRRVGSDLARRECRREPWIPALAAALAADGKALIRLGQPGRARAELERAARIAGEHGLPYVLREAREARRQLG